MTRGDKSKYTDKQKRKTDHIEEGYEARGVSEKEAEKRAWATVNKQDHGGKKGGRQKKASNAKIKGASPTIGLIVLAVVVLATGLVAIMTDRNRTRFENASVAAQIATTTAATSTSVSTISTSKVLKKTAIITPISITKSTTNLPLCTANDLTGTASWQRASGTLAGTVTITNSSKRSCAFSYDVSLQILSGTTALPIDQTANHSSGSLKELSVGESAGVNFVWGNWCKSPLASAASARVTLVSGNGYLKVPFIAPSGRAQSDSPSCVATSTQSYVYIL